jgi:molybdopterin-binding protein
MAKAMELLKPREAAAALGISYPTLKNWILSGKLKTVKTAGGHHRVPVRELDPYLRRSVRRTGAHPEMHRISGRNQLVGRVVELRVEGLLAKVVLSIGDQRITSIITADAVRELALRKGDTAIAIIKSTEVMIGRP